MRLIDADAMWERNKNSIYDVTDLEEMLKYEPTAYDIDKVAERLEADSLVKLYGSGNSDNYLIPVNRAIEIVKAGEQE